MSDEVKMLEVVGLYLNTSQAGSKYFSGKLRPGTVVTVEVPAYGDRPAMRVRLAGGDKMLVFKNDKATEENNWPPYRLYAPIPEAQRAFVSRDQGATAKTAQNGAEEEAPF